jgi:hypothetical protein
MFPYFTHPNRNGGAKIGILSFLKNSLHKNHSIREPGKNVERIIK